MGMTYINIATFISIIYIYIEIEVINGKADLQKNRSITLLLRCKLLKMLGYFWYKRSVYSKNVISITVCIV